MADDGRTRLADARLYLCTDARRSRGDLVPFLDAVLGAGVDIIQLREKGLEAGEELRLLGVFADACRRHGCLLAVNDRADVALAAGGDRRPPGPGARPGAGPPGHFGPRPGDGAGRATPRPRGLAPAG